MTLANKITVVRIMGIPVFVLLMVYYMMGLRAGEANPALRLYATLVFVALSLSDALDGYFARVRGQITKLGSILDPLADKALLLSVLVLFTRPGLPELQPQFPIWFTVLVISRELVLILGSLLVHTVAGTVTVRARLSGKLATACFMLTVLLAVASGPVALFNWMIWSTGLLVAVSGCQYLLDGFRQLEAVAAKPEG